MGKLKRQRQTGLDGQGGTTAVNEDANTGVVPEAVINGMQGQSRGESKRVEDLMVGHESMDWANNEYAGLMEENGISARGVYDGLKKIVETKYDGRPDATNADLQGVINGLVTKKAEDDELRERQTDTDAPKGVCEWPDHRGGKNHEFAPMKEKVLRKGDDDSDQLVVATYPDGNPVWKGDHLTHPATGQIIRVCAKCQPFAAGLIMTELQRAHLEANSRTKEEVDRLMLFRSKGELKRVLESTDFNFKHARRATTFRAYADAKRISNAILGITESSVRTKDFVSSFRGPARVTHGRSSSRGRL